MRGEEADEMTCECVRLGGIVDAAEKTWSVPKNYPCRRSLLSVHDDEVGGSYVT